MDKFFKVKPFDHQQEVFEEIKDKEYHALFWEMGTGKTYELIHVLRHKINQGLKEPWLIICPLAVTENWKKELIMFSPNPKMAESVQVLTGPKEERLEKLMDPNAKIFIINYEGVGRIKEIEYVLRAVSWGGMILDEAQRIKNHKAKQTRAIIQISRNAKNRFIATGTPILNSLMDIFTLYLFLDRGKRFGENYFEFQNKYFRDANASWKGKPGYFPDWKPKMEKADQVNTLLFSCADRKLKTDCLSLPDKVYENYYIEMDKKQTKVYNEMKDDLISYFESGAAVASTALVKMLKLNQITSGFINTVNIETGEETLEDVSHNKITALKELVSDLSPSKVIIWAYFRHDIERIRHALADYNPVVIYGGVSGEDREKAIDNFQNNPDCTVFIGQQRAAGLGITLTAASYAIYFSQGYSLEDRLQSEDRCHRAGSEVHSKVTYIDLICKNTIDEAILGILKNKQNFASTILKDAKTILEGGEITNE